VQVASLCPQTWQRWQKRILSQTPELSGGDRANLNCPSSCGKIGERDWSRGPWLVVIGGMQSTVSEWGQVGWGLGDGEMWQVAVTGGGVLAKMVVPTCEVPLALAKN
jgi:hypothetical protein